MLLREHARHSISHTAPNPPFFPVFKVRGLLLLPWQRWGATTKGMSFIYIHAQVFRSIMERGEGRRRRDVQEINDQTSSKSSTRGRQQRLATAAIGKVLMREAVGNGYSILRFRKSSCARPLAKDTASCAFASPWARGRWQRIQHPALS